MKLRLPPLTTPMILALQLTPAAVLRGAEPATFPGPAPGKPTVSIRDEQIQIENNTIRAAWTVKDGRFLPESFAAGPGGTKLTNLGEAFCLSLKSGVTIKASELRVVGLPIVETLETVAESAQLAARIPGKVVRVNLEDASRELGVVWRAILRDDANYVRQEVAFTALQADCEIREIILFNAALPGARAQGSVDGSPIVAGNFFLGYEDPMAVNTVAPSDRDSVLCRLRRNATLKQGETLTQSFVLGVAPAGQLRRAFLHYLERERAHPYRPFLHYNSWYDTAWNPFALNETNCIEAIRLCGERFIRPHGVTMDAMVFDDGWDDPKTLWQFHQGFPRGFTPLTETCREYDTRLGVWLSPFGGYGQSKEQRIKFGREQGYEINATGFSLAGRNYYGVFRQACVNMIRKFGVNHFKFDGIATGMYASGGAEYVLDTEAMRRLMLDLRQEDPNLYINLTTGSWPSPFWLHYADSLWRQGDDMGLAGKGSKQQQWLTYRDQEVYRNVVRKAPLYPLNSLMTQGVAYSRHGSAGEPTFNSAGFKDDVRAFFGSGTSLQELYIQPDKLTAQDWAVLAEAAKWSRANADVLVDTHWIGGDPAKLEVYGYASWTPRQGIVMLRNPDDHAHDFALDVGAAFELPAGAPKQFSLRSPWMEDAAKPTLLAMTGQSVTLQLKPFEVLLLEATPAPPALIPQPAHFDLKPGAFRLTSDTRVVATASANAEATNLAAWLRAATQLKVPVVSEAPSGNNVLLEHRPALAAQLGAEGYRLAVTPEQVRIQAATEAGLFYGGITLRQLFPTEAFGNPPAGGNRTEWPVPCVAIEDHPRFPWRGLLVDPARHFLPLAFLKKLVDVMALHKLNTLQLHLTDDQGWRLEIKKYPRLTQIGSVRQESPRRSERTVGDGTPYGPFFYTQAEMRELVAYAQIRHVTILPEIEMPGHFLGALTAYPEFSCTGGPFAVRTQWGVEQDILCPGNAASVAFAQDILAEVCDVFPSRFIHIGGDEAPRDRWQHCPKCQARMQAEGLKSEAQLQTWLNHQLEEFLGRRGRQLIGWDEILEGGLTPGATVMSWRGVAGGIAAAEAGHDVVMAPTTHCYFDYAQAEGPGEPESIGSFIPLEKVYAFDPLPPGLPAAKQHYILGAQGNLWGEFLWTPSDVEYFAFPRAVALAEVVWSSSPLSRFPDFQRRLAVHLKRLEALGVNFRRPSAPATEAEP